jgi:bifunctional enzyme CysN/CysC
LNAAKDTGATVWLTGLSGAGKTTIATECVEHLVADGRLEPVGLRALILDGDELREGLNADLSFSAEDRAENVRRVGEVALLFARHGHLVLVPVISPYLKDRLGVRQRHDACVVPFVEVHVATTLATCEARDPKGLYRRARAGEIGQFTGISDPYEPPESPEVRLESEGRTPAESARALLEALERLAVVPRPR